MAQTVHPTGQASAEADVSDMGTIVVRVVVLPPKVSEASSPDAEGFDGDDGLEDDFLSGEYTTPLGSYLENSRGKRCVVFLVNGQRQEALENAFIVQELGFKYLRNRMMIVVDVDGLAPEALGRMMQGSRQGFYRGDVWHAISRRIVSLLKDDPDLLRLEEEAEAQVSELRSGDEKVKETLDRLIDMHHVVGPSRGDRDPMSEGPRTGVMAKRVEAGVVTLSAPDVGEDANFPVLTSHPTASSVRLRPGEVREVLIACRPSDAWTRLSALWVEASEDLPELSIQVDRSSTQAVLKLVFDEGAAFDQDRYPVHGTFGVIATFDGLEEPRRLDLRVFVKPDQLAPDPELTDEPSIIMVSSRVPVKLHPGGADVHVRLRWDGRDSLVAGSSPSWRLQAAMRDASERQPRFSFSDPSAGRFELVIEPDPAWTVGDNHKFDVTAVGPAGRSVRTTFVGRVVDPPDQPVAPDPKVPRLVKAQVATAPERRVLYELKYIRRDQYDQPTCWNGRNWSDEECGCYKEPNGRSPLTLIINEDMDELRLYRASLGRLTETEIQRRVTKYTSHVAYHLYQMYQAAADRTEEDLDVADARRRDEIRRLSMTLLKLMETSR